MALKVLMLKRDRDRLVKELEDLRKQQDGFEARERSLEEAINELDENASQDERDAVQEEVEKFEQERDDLETRVSDLEDRVKDIEDEIAKMEEDEPGEGGGEEKHEVGNGDGNRGMEDNITMKRTKNFRAMSRAEVNTMLEREDVKSFLEQVRTAIGNKRALTNVGLTIPEVFMGVIKENLEGYSKLYKHVNVRQISGDGREVIMGTIPEAVWTEACGVLNELDLTFNDVEVDCYKVGGYFVVCNAALEDSDINLADELLSALGQAIGLALDKAILFGTGTKMPKGFVTRLEETSQPADYPATARPWVDLHTKNMKKTNNTGVTLFQDILEYSGAAKNKYSGGGMTWIINNTTYTYLKAQAMSINAAGAIVSGMEDTMPVVGGPVEILDFVPDNMIFGGYLDLYLLAERAGIKLAQSEHVKFIEDRTVFKSTARYDGQPAIAEGFVAIGVKNTTPTGASITFAPDDANPDESE